MSEPGVARLCVTMIRCATLLLEAPGLRLLTDPWFSMHLRGLPCFRRPSCSPQALPAVDALLVSHLHPDHWDARAVSRMCPVPPVAFLPPGSLARLKGPLPGWRELAPWTSAMLGSAEVFSVPGPHTGPAPEEVNFLLSLPGWGTVFFGGDARLDEQVLTEVRRRHGAVRLALLPVGGTRILGRRTVMSPEDALRAADLLGASRIVPIHEGGIWMSVPPLSLHPGRAADLSRLLHARGESNRLLVLREGESADV